VAEQPWGIVVGGVGGTGVITIGQLLGMAAHLEGKGVVGAGLRPASRRRAAPPGATSQIANRPEAHAHHQAWTWRRPTCVHRLRRHRGGQRARRWP
jgi:hypothetical protein